ETFLKKGFRTSQNFWKIFRLNFQQFCSADKQRYAMWGPNPTREEENWGSAPSSAQDLIKIFLLKFLKGVQGETSFKKFPPA
ncbi:MAG: hypothetical protein IJY66_07840, partial [Clostridia bacterium]|nr:hypothetical protein [Clostridia bacterium]